MPSEWIQTTLGALGTFRNGVNFNRGQEGAGIPVLKVKDFGDRSLVPDTGLDELTEDKVPISRDHYLNAGDTVIMRSNGNPALVGRSMFFRGSSIPVTFSGFCIRFRPDISRVHARFAAYLIRSPYFRERFSSHGSGTGITNLSQDLLASVPVVLPCLDEQLSIAEVLGALDDRIELALRTSEQMELIARTIFKSWFVDFDPVRVKGEGREPEGMDSATAALFPDEFEDAGILTMPRGWSSCALNSTANFLNGLALQKYPAISTEDSIPAIKIAQLKRGSAEGADRISRTLPPQYLIQDGDLIFSWSGSLEVVIWCGGEGALNQHLFKVTSEIYPQWFVYGWLKKHLEHFREVAASKVTTMGHIQRHHLTEALVFIPPPATLAGLGEVMSPLHERVIQARLQIRTLSELRDTLLPRLISGKLRVPEAEKLVEAVL